MSERSIRVEKWLVRNLNQTLRKYFSSEALGLTFMEVKIAPDFRMACVSYSVLGDDLQKKKMARFLSQKKGFFQKAIASEASFKYIPVLRFAYSDAWERGSKVIELLDELDPNI